MTLKKPLEKGGIFQSNQLVKNNIAQSIINQMQAADPSDLKQMEKLKINIEQMIKYNEKATGVRLWNKGGNLNKHLNSTLNLIENHINNLKSPKDKLGVAP